MMQAQRPAAAQGSHEPPAVSRAVHLLLCVVIALAFVGFVVGIRQGTPTAEYAPPSAHAAERHSDAVLATDYASFDRRRHGPNRDWFTSLAMLHDLEPPDPADADRSDAARHAVLAARASRRAFDGAPPVVPHPIDQMTTAACMACHGPEGRSIGQGVVAPAMSHAFMANCTQCHVEMESVDLAPFVLAENSFEGRDAPFGGSRAWTGAPPVIPHTLFMRENCMSCHGPTGPDPIRTTHPWQVNCTQCHAPSAVLDQAAIDHHTQWLPPPRTP